jgi:hypothetical protein
MSLPNSAHISDVSASTIRRWRVELPVRALKFMFCENPPNVSSIAALVDGDPLQSRSRRPGAQSRLAIRPSGILTRQEFLKGDCLFYMLEELDCLSLRARPIIQ